MIFYKVLTTPFKNSCRHCSTQKVRVRFAPSPTGFLHLGGLRTALYNYLFAKANNGTFILRIEDTDQTRLVKGADKDLQKDLLWSGIKIDEAPGLGDFGPYKQSKRLHLYREQVKLLLNNNTAYHCFCTDRRLDLLRREAQRNREVPKYDNKCRHLTKEEVETRIKNNEANCIRFKLSSDVTVFDDLIYGGIAYDVSLIEGDPVIMKSDGFPTYHFANVVDDHFMKITHVLRGVEWQVSTTKHLLLYKAFGWSPPQFGHLPLLLNSDGSKLSKRQGDIRVGHYRNRLNVFPLALLNFIVNAGGGFAKDLEQNVKSKIFTLDELASQFDIKRINTHSAKLMPERLYEFNRLELKRQLQSKSEESRLVLEVQDMVKINFRDEKNSLCLNKEHIKNVLHWSVNRIDTLKDLLDKNLSFVWFPSENYILSTKEVEWVKAVIKILECNDEFTKDNINIILKGYTTNHGIHFKQFMKTMRSILSGLKEGPGVAEMMEILGKSTTLERLRNCIEKS